MGHSKFEVMAMVTVRAKVRFMSTLVLRFIRRQADVRVCILMRHVAAVMEGLGEKG